MRSIQQFAERNVPFTGRCRDWSLIALFLMAGTFFACGNYKEYDPSPTGMFYPNGCVNLRGRKANSFLVGSEVYTICQPVRISEVGIMTLEAPENAGDHEVASLEFSDGGVFVWTSTLKRVGRIEYANEARAPVETLWRKIQLGFWRLLRTAGNSVVAVLVILFFFLLLIKAGSG